MRRVEEFSGVVVLAYAFMSNHFHIFVYMPKAEEIDEVEVMQTFKQHFTISFNGRREHSGTMFEELTRDTPHEKRVLWGFLRFQPFE